MMYSFDVFTAHHDDIKTGDYKEVWSRVNVSSEAYPTYGMAADVAACIAVAIHGGMPTRILPRI